jgi:5'-3' exonuclease
MGIPSYFRSILQKYPGCLKSSLPSKSSDTLCFDFNCLIYRCIRAPSMPPYPESGESNEYENDEWEKQLLAEVVNVVREVWDAAGKPKTVLLAVDGVVPMAKIRQQRVRRFKSAWLRGEASGGKQSSWDTNAITPGTRFMEKLGIVLKGITMGSAKCIVSGADEEGEGEHKIMRWLRQQGREQSQMHAQMHEECEGRGNVIVYGLDADLILLTMLAGEECDLNIHLLREKQEFGGKREDVSSRVQEYQFLDIREFQKRIGQGSVTSGLVGTEEVLNYIALMSLMGNDFLPHSLTHKLADGGHDCVLQELNLLRKNGWLLDSSGQYKISVLKGIFKRWSLDEDERILHMIQKKQEQARRGVGKGMDASEGLPLEWAVENVLLSFENNKQLSDEWRQAYWEYIHPCADSQYKESLCEEYLRGFQWILDYYKGDNVNVSWMFPAWIPPLWSDLSSFCERAEESGFLPIIYTDEVRPIPQEQLAMVLPLESWGLIRNPKLRSLPALAPQMWPRKFGFFSLGRKWMWECEARIPVLTAGRLREEMGGAM